MGKEAVPGHSAGASCPQMSTYAILGGDSTVNVNKDSLEFITRKLQIKI